MRMQLGGVRKKIKVYKALCLIFSDGPHGPILLSNQPTDSFPYGVSHTTVCLSFSVVYFSVQQIRIMSRYSWSLLEKDVAAILFTGDNWQ